MLPQRLSLAVLASILLLALSACGQIGPLTLPDSNVNGEEEPDDEDNER